MKTAAEKLDEQVKKQFVGVQVDKHPSLTQQYPKEKEVAAL